MLEFKALYCIFLYPETTAHSLCVKCRTDEPSTIHLLAFKYLSFVNDVEEDTCHLATLSGSGTKRFHFRIYAVQLQSIPDSLGRRAALFWS